MHRIPFIPKLVTLLIFLIYNSKVPYQARIGIGVVIHSESVIGRNCSVGQQVTIGGGKFPLPGCAGYRR